MKVLLASLALGLAALLPQRAHAWAELDFYIHKLTPADRSVTLQCDANYAAPCAKGGMSKSYVQGWNPLDGSRWSNYRLVFEGRHTVELDMYDRREGCPVGSGWQRGWLWILYATGPDGKTMGPYNICTTHELFSGKETLNLAVRWMGWRNAYDFDFMRTGPWRNPSVAFEFNPTTRKLTVDLVRP